MPRQQKQRGNTYKRGMEWIYQLKAKIGQMFEAEKSYQFLLGLNYDLYSEIHRQILAMEPLPSVEKIFNIVTQEEKHKKLMLGRDDRSETPVAYAVSQGGQTLGSSDRGACKHCRRFRHNESSCYQIIGHPLSWGIRRKGWNWGRGTHGGRVTGSRGRRGGHETAYFAGQIASGQQQAQIVKPAEQSNHVAVGFTTEKVKRLFSLIEPWNSGYEKL